MTNLLQSFTDFNDSLQKQPSQYAGLLGIPIDGQFRVNVPSRAGFVYVRLRDNLSEVAQAYNDKVSPIRDLPVLIQRNGNNWIVVGKDTNRYTTWGTSAPFLPQHGSQHSFNRDLNTGGDTVWVYPDQFMPLLVYPTGSLGSGNLLVAPYVLKRTNDFIYVGNTGTQDLVMYKPTNSQAILGLVCLNRNTGNPEVIIASGTPMSATATGTPDIMAYLPYPSSNQEPLYAFRLVSGTSRITWDNLYNVRQFIGGGSSVTGSSGGGGTPAGSDREVQYNNAGAFGADSEFIYQTDLKALGIGDYDLMPFDTTRLFWNVGDNVSPGHFGLAYGSTRAPFVGFAKADGTGTTPTNVKANQVIGRIRGYGYDGGSWSGVQAEMNIVASGNWITGSFMPTRFEFDVTPSGSATKRTQFSIHGDSVNIPTGSTYARGGVPIVHSVSAGSNISVDSSNPAIPIISSSGAGADGWISTSWAGLARVSDFVFETTSNLTSVLQKGYKLKFTDTTTKYLPIISVSAYTGGKTTITCASNADYKFVGTPSNFSYSNVESPFGYPEWFNVTAPTFDTTLMDNGSGGQPTTTNCRMSIKGRMVNIHIKGNGTKASTTWYFSFSASGFPTPANYATSAVSGYGNAGWSAKDFTGTVKVISGSFYLVFDEDRLINDNQVVTAYSFNIGYEI